MVKKKILVFNDYYEPGYKAGGPITTLRNIFKISSDSFTFFLITRNHDAEDKTPYPFDAETWIKNTHVQVMYLSGEKLTKRFLERIYSEIDPDIIYLNSFCSYKFSILPILSFKKKTAKIVLAPRGEFSRGALSQKGLRK